MEGHFERDFSGAGAIRGKERVAECATGFGGEPFGKFNGGLVCKASQHDMFQLAELVGNGGINTRVAVTKKIDPPGANAIEVAFAFEVFEPDTFGTGNRHQRQRRMVFHLRARVPDRSQASLQPVGIGGHISAGCSAAPQ